MNDQIASTMVIVIPGIMMLAIVWARAEYKNARLMQGNKRLHEIMLVLRKGGRLSPKVSHEALHHFDALIDAEVRLMPNFEEFLSMAMKFPKHPTRTSVPLKQQLQAA